MATRLAMLRFIFRARFPEERGVGPCAADQALLRSHSLGASDTLSVCPSKPEFRIEAGLFRTLILERLRLPLQVTEKVCECGILLDSTGRHRAACNRSGRLKTRAQAPHCFLELSWLWTSQSAAPLLRTGRHSQGGQGRRTRNGRAQNSSVVTGVVWSLFFLPASTGAPCDGHAPQTAQNCTLFFSSAPPFFTVCVSL